MTRRPPAGLGAEEARVARGSVVQQFSQTVGLVALLVSITVIGRHLSLAEFGIYGLLVSVSAYILVVQLSVEAATVRAISAAADVDGRDGVVTSALVLYTGVGLLAGLLLGGGSALLASLLPVPHGLESQAREGAVALAVVSAVGWPCKVAHDLLRGSQRFGAASAAECAGYGLFVTGNVILVAVKAPLWALIALGGSTPILIGLAALCLLAATRTLPRLRAASARWSVVRRLGRSAAQITVASAADIVIYMLDRVILIAFTSAAVVGLYEAAARPQALVRQVQGTLTITVLPVGSAYAHAGDLTRLRELLLRGTRYVAAVVVPLAATIVALAEPIIRVWLGPRYTPASTALAILVGYWMLSAAASVGGSMLLATGHVRELTRYVWGVALGNLVLSLALTPVFGLEGVVLGTAIPQLVGFPIFLRLLARLFPVTVRELVTEAVAPALAAGALVIVALLGVRALWSLDSLAGVAIAAVAGLLVGYAAYYALALRPRERLLVRSLLGRAAQ